MRTHRWASGSGTRLIVQQVHRPPGPRLRYIDQVINADRSDSDIEFVFSEGMRLQKSVRVLHVHDEHLDSLLKFDSSRHALQLLSLLSLVARLKARRIALVRTVSDDTRRPHPRSRIASLTSKILDAATAIFITFDDVERDIPSSRRVVIPHAVYGERFVGYPQERVTPGRTLWIGRGSPSQLRGMARQLTASDAHVRHICRPGELMEAGKDGSGTLLSMRRESLSDGALVQEVSASELVVVPDVRSLEGLQSVFVAMSIGRPVVVPATPAMTALAVRIGGDRLHLAGSQISAADIDRAYLQNRQATGSAALSAPGLIETATAYASAYRRAAGPPR